MENLEIMMTLFAIVIVGYVAGKMGYMGGDFDRRLSNIVIDITCPSLILSSTMGGTLPHRDMILPLLLISLLTYLLLAGVAFFLPRYLTHRPDERGIVGFALMFGNVGFIGYPVVASIFGHQAVFYAAVLNVVNTFAVFTVGTMLITKNSSKPNRPTPSPSLRGRGADSFAAESSKDKSIYSPPSQGGAGGGSVGGGSVGGGSVGGGSVGGGSAFGFSLGSLLLSTPMLAAYLSILIVALGINNVPSIISQPLTMIGNITVPAALLIIGSSMSHLSARTMLGNRTVYLTTLFRLCLLPLAIYFLSRLVGFSPLVVSINTVVIAMPVATYGTILCLKHGHDTTLITEVTFITTLLSVLTIPLAALLFASGC
jgi:predicted permease